MRKYLKSREQFCSISAEWPTAADKVGDDKGVNSIEMETGLVNISCCAKEWMSWFGLG